MAIDWFGLNKRLELKKEVLKREISDLIDLQEGRAILHDWHPSDQTDGRSTRVSYKTLEAIYKKESWVRACIDSIARTSTSNGFNLVTLDENDSNPLMKRETKRIMRLLRNPNPDDSFSDIIQEVSTDIHLYGDAYLEVVKDSKGLPIAIFNLYAPSMRVLVNRQGKVLNYLILVMRFMV